MRCSAELEVVRRRYAHPVNEPEPTAIKNVESPAIAPSKPRFFVLSRSHWRGWRRELTGAGFFLVLAGFFFIQPFLAPAFGFHRPLLGCIPTLFIIASALLPLCLGSRVHRVIASLCILLAIYLGYGGYRELVLQHEHRQRKVEQQHETAPPK